MTQVTQVNPRWLGSFFGADLGFHNYEILTIQHIPRKEHAEESALMRSKWFDYRRLHPMQATYYFAASYSRAYGTFMAIAVDRDLGNMRGIKGKDFLCSREKLAIWRLRQMCDRFGVRYDFFLRHAMKWYAERSMNAAHSVKGVGGRVYAVVPPRPAQMMSNQEMITDVMLAWEEHVAAKLPIADDPFYSVQNFVGHADQIAYEQSIVAAIRTRPHPRFSVHAALYVHDALRIETALEAFGERTVLEAISFGGG